MSTHLVLILVYFFYYFTVINDRLSSKGYFNEMPLNKYKIFLFIPLSYWVYSLYILIKQSLTK